MLVLSRKANQHIVIGDHVKVVIVAVQGGRVKLGFSAPAEVPIHRGEVHQRLPSEDCETHLGPNLSNTVDSIIVGEVELNQSQARAKVAQQKGATDGDKTKESPDRTR